MPLGALAPFAPYVDFFCLDKRSIERAKKELCFWSRGVIGGEEHHDQTEQNQEEFRLGGWLLMIAKWLCLLQLTAYYSEVVFGLLRWPVAITLVVVVVLFLLDPVEGLLLADAIPRKILEYLRWAGFL